MKSTVIMKRWIGSDKSENLTNEDLNWLKEEFDKSGIEMTIYTEQIADVEIERLNQEELEDFVKKMKESKKKREEEIRLEMKFELDIDETLIN